MNNYILTFSAYEGGGQFSQLCFDIEATDDQTAAVVANEKLDEHHVLKNMTTLHRVEDDGSTTLIARA